MGRLWCIAGHSKDSPGARAYNGSYEHDYTTMLQRYIVREHINRYVESGRGDIVTDDEKLSLSRVIEYVNANAKRGDYGIDLHFNNNNPHATGTEGFVSPHTTEKNKQIATNILLQTSKIVNIPLRRYVPQRAYKYPEESHLGRLAIIQDTKIPFFLYEGCFLNETDLSKFIACMKQIAGVILDNYH